MTVQKVISKSNNDVMNDCNGELIIVDLQIWKYERSHGISTSCDKHIISGGYSRCFQSTTTSTAPGAATSGVPEKRDVRYMRRMSWMHRLCFMRLELNFCVQELLTFIIRKKSITILRNLFVYIFSVIKTLLIFSTHHIFHVCSWTDVWCWFQIVII